MTTHSKEEREGFKALDRLAAAVALQAESTEKIAEAVERLADPGRDRLAVAVESINESIHDLKDALRGHDASGGPA